MVAAEELVLADELEEEELDELALEELELAAAADVEAAVVVAAAAEEAVSVGSEPTPMIPSRPPSVARTLIIRFACLLCAIALTFASGVASTKAIRRVSARSVDRRALRWKNMIEMVCCEKESIQRTSENAESVICFF